MIIVGAEPTGGVFMSQIFFTISGTQYRHGHEFIEQGMQVKLVKEPDNEYDREAIRVEMDGLGQIGWVANSVNTVLGESMSAGRIYDKMGEVATGTVKFVLPRGVICTLDASEESGDEMIDREIHSLKAKIKELENELELMLQRKVQNGQFPGTLPIEPTGLPGAKI